MTADQRSRGRSFPCSLATVLGCGLAFVAAPVIAIVALVSLTPIGAAGGLSQVEWFVLSCVLLAVGLLLRDVADSLRVTAETSP